MPRLDPTYSTKHLSPDCKGYFFEVDSMEWDGNIEHMYCCSICDAWHIRIEKR
jgi:hypothetical protein